MIMFRYCMLFAYLFFCIYVQENSFSSIQRYGAPIYMYILPLFCRHDSRTGKDQIIHADPYGKVKSACD